MNNPSAFPLGEPNDGFAQYFDGQIHHHAAQILIAVGGRGYYQLEGEEPKELEPGQAVRIPPDVKHWHGAAPHEAFSHLAFMIADGTGDATNEWLEPVDPDAYGTLR